MADTRQLSPRTSPSPIPTTVSPIPTTASPLPTANSPIPSPIPTAASPTANESMATRSDAGPTSTDTAGGGEGEKEPGSPQAMSDAQVGPVILFQPHSACTQTKSYIAFILTLIECFLGVLPRSYSAILLSVGRLGMID